MSEPLKSDADAPLTPFVRQFRRVARLAAADPLRLLPLDPLTQLVTLGAPIAALLDVAPFERLREAIAGPAAARRSNVAHGRLQPLSDRDTPGRTRSAALAANPPSGDAAPGPAVPTAARRVTSPRPTTSLSSAPQPRVREPASTATLAERRAALRRVSAEPASRSRSTTPEVARASKGNGVSTAPSSAREISLRHACERNDEAPGQMRRDEPATPFAARVSRQGTHEPSPIHARGTGTRQSDAVLPPAGLGSLEATFVGDGRQSTLRSARIDRDLSAPSGVSSPRSRALSPSAAGAMPQPADTNAAKRNGAPEPPAAFELADALFETLYRDGVDLSWP